MAFVLSNSIHDEECESSPNLVEHELDLDLTPKLARLERYREEGRSISPANSSLQRLRT